MSIRRFFKWQFPLRRRIRGVAFPFLLLLFLACGGEETITNPINGSTGSEQPEPQPSNYFPMTPGSRWVYRNPDGAKWSREVTETQKFDTELYHSFSYDSPLQDNQLDSLGSAEYLTYFDRLVRSINLKDINDAVWQIILESGGESPNWSFHYTFSNGVWQTHRNIFNPPEILAFLFRYNTSVVWHSKLTLLRFPLVPGKTYKALNLRLSGRYVGWKYIHAYEAEGVILGKVGDDRELVETSAGAFEDCLKIQYEAKPSLKTEEFPILAAELPAPTKFRKVVESDIREELTDLLTHLMPKLGLRTVWLAPGGGAVKIETPNGIAELIDYDIKGVASVR